MRRLIVAIVMLLLVAATASYAGYWFYIAGRLPEVIAAWAEGRRADGYSVRWDSLAVGGFPASFRVPLAGAAFAGARPLPFQTAAATVIGEARPWNLRRWRVNAPQGARVEAPSEGDTVAAAALDATVAIGADDATVALAAHQIVGGGAAAALRIATADAQLVLPARAPADHRQDGARLTLRLMGIAVPRAVPSLGATVDAVTLSGALKGAVPAGQLRQALTASIENHDAVIDAAVAGGTLRADDASLAKVLLGLMVKPGIDGKKQLTLPVTLQNRRLYLGPAQIAVLPAITWE